MHGSKGRGWKRALATARGSEHRRETGGISATAYGSYRASPLPDQQQLARANRIRLTGARMHGQERLRGSSGVPRDVRSFFRKGSPAWQNEVACALRSSGPTTVRPTTPTTNFFGGAVERGNVRGARLAHTTIAHHLSAYTPKDCVVDLACGSVTTLMTAGFPDAKARSRAGRSCSGLSTYSPCVPSASPSLS